MSYAVVLGGVFAVHVLAMSSPGPNVLVVTQTALSDTRRAGIVTALGVAAGSTLGSSGALFSLSVVFAQVARLYSGLRLLGGMYLLYLGIKLWRTAEHPLVPSSSTHATVHTDRQAFRLGLLTNLTNPKAIVFFGSIFAALLATALCMWVKLAAIGIVAVDATGWHDALACFFSTRRARQVYRRIKGWWIGPPVRRSRFWGCGSYSRAAKRFTNGAHSTSTCAWSYLMRRRLRLDLMRV